MRILLTGAFGNVGENVILHVCEHNQKNHQPKIILTCFDKSSPLTTSKFQTLEKIFGNTIQVIWGDITNESDVALAVRNQDAVIHLAAIIPPIAYQIPEIARKVNVDGTKNLLKCCEEEKIKPRFVFASSYSVHGPRNPHLNLPLLSSQTQCCPKDLYGKHKVECETILSKYSGEWVILRLGAISVNLATMNQAKTSPTMFVLAFGIPSTQHRHAVHSKDVACAFVNAAMTNKQVSKKILMIGGDETWKTTALDFTIGIFNAMGLSFPTYAMRTPSVHVNEAYYYEDWMDTKEAQDLLNFQHHTLKNYQMEIYQQIGFLRYWLSRLVSPLVKWAFGKQSIHRFGADPFANKTMAELFEFAAIKEW